MKTIDEISKHIRDNGYAGLTDEEIDSWIKHKNDIAIRDTEFQKKLETYDKMLEKSADESRRAANAAIETLNNLINTPLNLIRVGDDD